MGTLKTTITQHTSPAGEKKLYANIMRYSNIDNEQPGIFTKAEIQKLRGSGTEGIHVTGFEAKCENWSSS